MFTIKDVRDEVFYTMVSAVASQDYGQSPILVMAIGEDDESIVLKMSDGSAAYLTVNLILEPCQYVHPHTSSWCGHPFCRAS